MKIPLFTQPPPTPVKTVSPKNTSSKLIAEGSFYRIYKTRKNTVLRISKRRVGEQGMNEVEILRKIRRHPFINKMKKWWIEEGLMHFEMEECECNLDEVIQYGDSHPDSSVISHSDIAIIKSTAVVANTGSFISDPFSDSVAPCSTSIIITDDSSEEASNQRICCEDDHKNDPVRVSGWINILMYQMSSALSYVHSKGIVHMDIKPENVLIKDRKSLMRRMDGSLPADKNSMDDSIFKLCDFNISKIGEGCFSYDGDKIYMAPEILKNKCYFKSDVYSLGLIYLELTNWRSLPTEGEEYQRLRRNDFEGWRVDEIGRRMLEKNPGMRCSSKEVREYFQSTLK